MPSPLSFMKGMIFTAYYTSIAQQGVLAGQNVIFTESPIPCNKGLVIHRQDSGLFTLRGPGCACNQCFARYLVQFQGNLAVADGGTPATGATVAIALNGEPLASSIATVTPAATVTELNHVSTFAYVDVPRGCCATVSVEAGTQGINVQNAAIAFTRVA